MLSQIVVAPTGGAVVLAYGYGPAFLLNAASFHVSALVLTWLRAASPFTAHHTKQSWSAQARGGAQLIVRHRLLRALAAGQFLAALSACAISALLVVLAQQQLGLEARDYGLMLASIGASIAAGPLLLAWLVHNPRRPAFVFGPHLLRAAVDAVLANIRIPAVAIGGSPRHPRHHRRLRPRRGSAPCRSRHRVDRPAQSSPGRRAVSTADCTHVGQVRAGDAVNPHHVAGTATCAHARRVRPERSNEPGPPASHSYGLPSSA